MFNQLFENVDATKPEASRNTSAEIYVICKNFFAPKKIDPRLLDPKTVFSEVHRKTNPADAAALSFSSSSATRNHNGVEDPREVVTVSTLMNQKVLGRRQREGYEAQLLVPSAVSAEDFCRSSNPLLFVKSCSAISLLPNSDITAKIAALPDTDDEIRECCKDIKVLGRRELKILLKWRLKVRQALASEFRVEKGKKESTDQPSQDPSEDGTSATPSSSSSSSGSHLDPDEEELRRLANVEADMEQQRLRAAKRIRERRVKYMDRMRSSLMTSLATEVDQDPDLFSLRHLGGKKSQMEGLTNASAPDLLPGQIHSEDPEDDDSAPTNGKSKVISSSHSFSPSHCSNPFSM